MNDIFLAFLLTQPHTQAILKVLKKAKYLDCRLIAKLANVPTATTYRILVKLHHNDIIEMKKFVPYGKWKSSTHYKKLYTKFIITITNKRCKVSLK